MYASVLKDGEEVAYTFEPGRIGWLHVARGDVELAGTRLKAGDGVSIDEQHTLVLSSSTQAEVLLFDLASE